MKHGFEFRPLNKKMHMFFVTEKKNKTSYLAKEIIKALVNLGYDIPDDPGTQREILYWTSKATLEQTEYGYCIKGDGFTQITNKLTVVQL